jgi:hypothetical protein
MLLASTSKWLSMYEGDTHTHTLSLSLSLQLHQLFDWLVIVLTCLQELCNPLFGGLLLEQAALCCLYVNPPQFRKFNMHLIFAADRFRAAGQV